MEVKNIFIAFILNLSFSIFEFFGGIISNSISILSDSFHDMGDAISIGISYFLEKKSKKNIDKNYTYGYARYSLLAGVLTTVMLLSGSILIIKNAIARIINSTELNNDVMLLFAVVGFIINTIGVFFTKEGKSINQKAVNLHMLEDALGWIVVLIGSVIIKITNIKIIDPIMSIGLALFIFINALKNLKEIIDIFLEKTPKNIDIEKIKKTILNIKEIEDIHHIHVWSMDGINNYATMHILTKSKNTKEIKKQIREELKQYEIVHVIIETEDERCDDTECCAVTKRG